MSRLDEIKARLEAATPGPWTWDRSSVDNAWGDCGPDLVTVETEHRSYTHSGGEVVEYDIAKEQIITASGYDASSIHVEDADAALIANAPTDLAALVEALEAVVEYVTDHGFHDIPVEDIQEVIDRHLDPHLGD